MVYNMIIFRKNSFSPVMRYVPRSPGGPPESSLNFGEGHRSLKYYFRAKDDIIIMKPSPPKVGHGGPGYDPIKYYALMKAPMSIFHLAEFIKSIFTFDKSKQGIIIILLNTRERKYIKDKNVYFICDISVLGSTIKYIYIITH